MISARVAELEYRTMVDALARYGCDPNYFSIPADDPQTPKKEGATRGEITSGHVERVHVWY